MVTEASASLPFSFASTLRHFESFSLEGECGGRKEQRSMSSNRLHGAAIRPRCHRRRVVLPLRASARLPELCELGVRARPTDVAIWSAHEMVPRSPQRMLLKLLQSIPFTAGRPPPFCFRDPDFLSQRRRIFLAYARGRSFYFVILSFSIPDGLEGDVESINKVACWTVVPHLQLSLL